MIDILKELERRRTPLDRKIWLTDKGLQGADRDGLISGVDYYPQSDTAKYNGNLNPMTVNLPAASETEIRGFSTRMVNHSPLRINRRDIGVTGDVRSRVRRHGPRTVEYCPNSGGFIIYNSSAQPYSIQEGKPFCHVFVGGPQGSVISEHDHAIPITNREEVRRLLKGDYVGFNGFDESQILENGLVVLTSSDEMNIFSEPNPLKDIRVIDVKPSKLEIEVLPILGVSAPLYKPFSVNVLERLSLSPHVGIQLYDIDCNQFGNVNLQLGGIVDPGYEGPVEHHPVITGERILKPGMPVMAARIIYSENPVQLPYGHERRNSSFQGGHRASEKSAPENLTGATIVAS